MTHSAQAPVVGDTIADTAAVVAAMRAWEFEARRASALAERLDKIRAALAEPNVRAADRIKRLRVLLDEIDAEG